MISQISTFSEKYTARWFPSTLKAEWKLTRGFILISSTTSFIGDKDDVFQTFNQVLVQFSLRMLAAMCVLGLFTAAYITLPKKLSSRVCGPSEFALPAI